MFEKTYKTAAMLVLLIGSILITTPTIAQSEFVRVEHGGNIICGLREDNTIECNSAIIVDARTPPNFPPVEDISVGPGQVCTVLVGGDLECFGSGAFDLGFPPTSGAPYSSVFVSEAHACAINNNNGIECWGLDSNGRLDAPAGEFTQLSLSQQQGCAVNVSGGVECWGANDQGTSTVPEDLPPATKVIAGFATSCALLTDSSIQCWGRSTSQFDLAGPYVDFDLRAIRSIETGQTSLCAIDEQGLIDCTFVTFNSDFSSQEVDLEEPTGTGNKDVSLNSSNQFESGCYVTSAGDIECFGPETSTDAPSIDNSPSVPMVTGFTTLIYSENNVELFWDAAPDAFNVSGYEIQRNGEIVTFTSNASSFLFGDLVAGVSETFAVRRVNIDGAVGEFSTTVSVDTISGPSVLPPSTPAFNPPERLFEPNSLDVFVFCVNVRAELFWSSSSLTDDIDGFEIRRNGQFIAFTEDLSYFDSGFNPDILNNYDVIAIDLEDQGRFHGVASAVIEFVDEPAICGGL